MDTTPISRAVQHCLKFLSSKESPQGQQELLKLLLFLYVGSEPIFHQREISIIVETLYPLWSDYPNEKALVDVLAIGVKRSYYVLFFVVDVLVITTYNAGQSAPTDFRESLINS